jgi:hypothetical protein
MISARSVTRGLLIASTAVGGLMGSLLDRAVVATPAWRKLGPVAWAAYSRHADLGNGQIPVPRRLHRAGRPRRHRGRGRHG